MIPTIHLRPTRYCYILGGAVLVMWLAAINYANVLSYLVFSTVISLALVSAVHTCRNLAGLEVVACKTQPVFAQQNMRIGLFIRNRKGHDTYAITFDNPEVLPAGSLARLTSLEGHNVQTIDWMIPAPRRGCYLIPRVRVSTVFPLGLFRAWCWQPTNIEYTVYPRPLGNRLWTEGEVENSSPECVPQKGGSDFYGLRPYVPGDSPRHIHWKTAGRGGPLQVKEFGGGLIGGLWFDWSLLGGLDGEARLSQIAFWIVRAGHEALAYGVRLPGFTSAPGRGPRHEEECLRALALFEPHPPANP